MVGWVKLRVRRAVGCFSRGVSRVARKTTSRTYVISCKVARAVAMATVERAEMTCGRGEGVFNMILPYPLLPAGVASPLIHMDDGRCARRLYQYDVAIKNNPLKKPNGYAISI